MVLRKAATSFCLAWTIIALSIPQLQAGGGPTAKLEQTSAAAASWTTPLNPDEQVIQLLNRITFGPRPGDVERVRQMGIESFLNEQLHPEKIKDAAVQSRVAGLPTLSMTTEELAENFPEPGNAFKRAQPEGPKKPRQADAKGKTAAAATPNGTMGAQEKQMQGPQRVIMELAQEEVLRAVYSNRQLQEVMVQFWMNHFNIFAPKGADKWMTTSFERDTIRPLSLGKFDELLVATAKSPAMLFYLDNWMSAAPNPTYVANNAGRYRRSAPNDGRWRRSVGSGRRSLWQRIWGLPAKRPVPTPRPTNNSTAKPQGKRGLNENYGRELMELHTIGVNGGYTQRDVIEVARCLTGWTIDKPQRGGEFIFNPRMHDFGTKVVLNQKIPAGQGMEDGLKILHTLARHPATAKFISLKLCRRFVADDPPPALIDRASHAFLRSDGDIRAVLKIILSSPEFYSQAAFRAKVKSPLELVASSVRALGASTDASFQLLQLIARMGQPMFQYQAPTGFPDRASTWINSSSLIMRMNFALQFASNGIRGTQVDWKEFGIPDNDSAESVLAKLDQELLEGSLAPSTRETILKQLAAQELAGTNSNSNAATNNRAKTISRGGPEEPSSRGGTQTERSSPDKVSAVAGLVLASPEFQRR